MLYEYQQSSRGLIAFATLLGCILWICFFLNSFWVLLGICGLLQTIWLFVSPVTWRLTVTETSISWDSPIWPKSQAKLAFIDVSRMRIQTGNGLKRRVEIICHNGEVYEVPSNCYQKDEDLLNSCIKVAPHIQSSIDGAQVVA